MNAETGRLTLLDIRRKGRGIIIGLPEDEELRSQCIRLGLAIGATFTCIERLPGGTVVLESFRQEIALGHDLAKTIIITIQ